MKRIIVFFLFILLLAAEAGAQNVPLKSRPDFIVLRSGEAIYADKVQYKSPLFKSNHFLLDDSLKYPIEMVNTYQNQEGYFTRISYGGHKDAFAKRILEGPRISKFYSMRTEYNYGTYGYGYGYGMPFSNRRRIYYFSKDNGPLYELTLNNLEQALADSPSSMTLLKRHKRNKLIYTGMSIVGAGVLTYGILNTSNDAGANPNSFPSISPTVYAGAGLIALPFVIQLFQKDKLTQAMEVYNYELKQ